MESGRRGRTVAPAARRLLMSAGWGVGVAAGVALGAVLTIVSGSGAPGLAGLDVTSDLVLIPLACGAAVFLVHFAFSVAIGAVKRARTGEMGAKRDQQEEGAAEDRVERQVGTEVAAPEE